MAEIGEIRRFPIAVTLATMPRHDDGRLFKTSKVGTLDALLRSILDIAWNQQADSCVGPVVRFRLEPRRILCDLLVRQEEPVKAATWRNQRFNSQGFRDSTVRALARAVTAWEQGKFSEAFIADETGVRVMEAQAASDVKPLKI